MLYIIYNILVHQQKNCFKVVLYVRYKTDHLVLSFLQKALNITMSFKLN